jgi:hypothetical protein
MKTNRDESLRALLRLFLDEIVEDLSRKAPERGALRDAMSSISIIGGSQPRRRRQISAMKASHRILAVIAERPEFLLSVENKTHS